MSDNFSIVNNTFYDYLNRYNQTEDYYADTAKGSYTLENKTDFKVKFALGPVSNEIDAGFTYRYAHVYGHPELHERAGEHLRPVPESEHLDISALGADRRRSVSLHRGLQPFSIRLSR